MSKMKENFKTFTRYFFKIFSPIPTLTLSLFFWTKPKKNCCETPQFLDFLIFFYYKGALCTNCMSTNSHNTIDFEKFLNSCFLSYALCKLFKRNDLIFEMLIKQLFKVLWSLLWRDLFKFLVGSAVQNINSNRRSKCGTRRQNYKGLET